MSKFKDPDFYAALDTAWDLLPFRFRRMGERVLLTNVVGEHAWLREDHFSALVDGSIEWSAEPMNVLRARHIVRARGDETPLRLLAIKMRTRFERLSEFTGLHIFVVSLRCEHSCPYCQVSRQSKDKGTFDMSVDVAEKSLDLVFQSPSPALKIEFQGGEPLLNFSLIREIVERAKHRNIVEQRELSFVIATNLALLDDEVIDYCRQHRIQISTSLDGPRDLHNSNRPRPGNNSWELAVEGIRRVREELGADQISALMTTTDASLGRVREIVDTYVQLGLREIFLRPLSPYGFAVKTKSYNRYDSTRWTKFFREGLDYILELNASGIPIVEQHSTILLEKMLTNRDGGYVDLGVLAGIGIGAVVYNYDGYVYASDEARMLAEMGDTSFRLGNVNSDTYADIFTSDALLNALDQSFLMSVPMCRDCVFQDFCGADPVFHHATSGDPVGHKIFSEFCSRSIQMSEHLLTMYDTDPLARSIFTDWVRA